MNSPIQTLNAADLEDPQALNPASAEDSNPQALNAASAADSENSLPNPPLVTQSTNAALVTSQDASTSSLDVASLLEIQKQPLVTQSTSSSDVVFMLQEIRQQQQEISKKLDALLASTNVPTETRLDIPADGNVAGGWRYWLAGVDAFFFCQPFVLPSLKMGAKSTRLSLGLGLLLSLLVASTAFTASQLANKGVDAVYSQCFLHYLLLAFVYGSIMIHRGQSFLMANLGSKCVLTLVDVIAKASMIKAYKYTSLTSVMLLGCWTIPCVMVLSGLFLKTKCGFQKLVGLTICIAGLVAFVLFDVHSANRSSGINPLKGDLLIIIGATLYGVTNVCEEIFFKGSDRVEIMTFMGSYGAVLIGYQIVFNERSKFMSILFSPGTMLLVIGFSLALFLFYPGFLLLLKISGPRMLNVSLLTSIMWAVLIQIFVYHEKVDWIYFVCFAAVTLGLIVCSGRDEIDPNNREPVTIDEEALLCHSDKDGISNNDKSSNSF